MFHYSGVNIVGVGFLDNKGCVCLIYKKLPYCFPKWLPFFCSYQLLPYLQALLLFLYFNVSHYFRCLVISLWFLRVCNNLWHWAFCHVNLPYIFLGVKCVFKSFAHVKTFVYLSCERSIFWIQVLYQKCILWKFSCRLWLVFSFLNDIFEQKFYILMEIQFVRFFFCFTGLFVSSLKFLLNPKVTKLF